MNAFLGFANNALVIVGVFSIVVGIIRIIAVIHTGTEWIDNVIIEEHALNEDLDDRQGFYPQYFPCHPSNCNEEYATQNLFIPQNVIVRNLKIKRVEIVEKNGDIIERYKTAAKIDTVTPENPLCIVVARREAIPEYLLEWNAEYGIRTRYYLCDNLRSGDNNKRGFEYKHSLLSAIRRVLEIK